MKAVDKLLTSGVVGRLLINASHKLVAIFTDEQATIISNTFYLLYYNLRFFDIFVL